MIKGCLHNFWSWAQKKINMSMHPQGTTGEVVGISSGSSGRNCDEHPKCGVVVVIVVIDVV